jgi:ABC-type ATPase involved in cell division
MIRFENVFKRYPTGREALSGVSFNLERGEFAFLTGPSAASRTHRSRFPRASSNASVSRAQWRRGPTF